jgi:uncharacterized MnhB-related membrane protein
MDAPMTWALWAIDGVIAVTLVGLAVLVLATTDLFRGIVMFIAFGLVMAMAWARLQAVDIAMAEAAIGAGLTGALFLNALRHEARLPSTVLRPRPSTGLRPGPSTGLRPGTPGTAYVVVALAGGLAVVIAAGLRGLPAEFTGLSVHVAGAIADSGADNPVTAVLLNFRAYDTLLEVAVLLLALIGVVVRYSDK